MSEKKGFLGRADRPFLRGEKQYKSRQQRYDRRESIRTRTRAAFHDFALLFDEIDSDERNKIFDPPQEEAQDLMRAMVKTIGFLYHALEGDADSNAVSHRTFRYPFDQVLEHGVRIGEISRHEAASDGPWDGTAEVEFNVDVYRPQPTDRSRVVDDLAENEGRGLTDHELRTTIIHAARDPDQFRELADQIEERRTAGDDE